MFVLAKMKTVVRVPPDAFNQKLNDAIADELNRRLANKVILNVGLCIALFDITSLEDSFILPGDGASHTRTHFRFIVFRPFVEEIITGKIRSCSPEGVNVSLEFFDDILIPPNYLQQPSHFDEMEQAWVWKYESEDGRHHDLFMDAGDTIRFRMISEKFTDTSQDQLGPVQMTTQYTVPYSLIVCLSFCYVFVTVIFAAWFKRLPAS